MTFWEALQHRIDRLGFAGWQTRRLVAVILLAAIFVIDQLLVNGWIRTTSLRGWSLLVALVWDEWANVRAGAILTALTVFLAFVNLYIKISIQAPKIQRRLRPVVFLNVPFAIYVALYWLLSLSAYLFFFAGTEGPWLAHVLAASLIGIGVGNADIKFGGLSLLPLAEFLQSLEAVAQAGLSVHINEHDIAKRASLRDRLSASASVNVLVRELLLLADVADAAGRTRLEQRIEELRRLAGKEDAIFRALLAKDIVAASEENAQRLIDLPVSVRFPRTTP